MASRTFYSPGYGPLIEAQTASQKEDYRQWPWRGLAFASDLGTVGYLVKQHWLGLIGWLLALPYYAYALWRQPDSKNRKEEAVYQATANGFLPFMAAKVGTMIGELAHRKITVFLAEKYPTSGLNKLTCPMYKVIGGLATLLVLTPSVDDPISNWIMSQYKQFVEEGSLK